MWYLQADTFALLAVFSIIASVLRKLSAPRAFSAMLPVLSLAALWYISERLCLFYVAYIIMGIVCAKLLRKWRKPSVFLAFSLLALMPFFLSRSVSFGIELPFFFVSIGLAFAMLKIIDVFYYVYYTEQDIDALAFINYILLLPVFTAGPIFRYRDFLKSHYKPLKMDAVLLTSCFKRVILGMFKKIILAQAALLVLGRFMDMGMHWYVSLGAIVCSYLILYFDLSGYSDIAIAFGKLAGYDVPENFKKPWAAASFTQFWRSWHATLSDWIREHIYVIVAKKKLGRAASASIAFCTMVVMALWHGFNVPFLLAGIYNGALLGLENLLSLTTVNRRGVKKPIYVLRCLGVNLLFAANTLVFTLSAEQVVHVLRGLVHV